MDSRHSARYASAMTTSRPVARFLDRSTAPHVATLVAVTGLSALAMNIFLPSLPAMTDWFATDYRLMQLSVSLYLGVSAGLQIVIGPISDRFGRRPVLLWSVVLFLIATAGTLFAPTVGVFLAFRMMQAVVAAGMVLSRAVIRDMVPANEAASMIGYVTMGMAFVPMVGPMIGGILDGAFGWQANFLALFGLGVAVLWMIWADLGETAAGHRTRFADQMRQYPELLTSRRFWGYSLSAAFASGAFFAYVRHPHALSSPELAKRLVRDAGILLLPGTMFRPEGDPDGARELRIAFANIGADGIAEMCRRLAAFNP